HTRSGGTHWGAGRTQSWSGGGPGEGFLASTSRRDGGWVCSPFQMAEDLADDLALRDSGNDPQRPALTKRAGGHIYVKDPLEQPYPTPARRRSARLRLVEALLPWGREDRPTQVAMRREATPITHEVDVRQGHERRQLLQELQRREANARGAIGPRMDEGVEEIAVGLFLEALQGHRTTGGIPEQAFQLIAPVRRNRRVGVHGKA